MPLDGSTVYPLEPFVMAQVLDRAADLVERGWCSGALARNWLGFECSPYAYLGRRYCARGAILRALWDEGVVAEPAAHELAVAREIVVAAPQTPAGERFMMGWQYETLIRYKQPYKLPVDLAALQGWNDASRDGGAEVAALLRFAAKACRP